ncbi:Sec-independent protein translocase protein TatB [Brevundimonas sp.]|uniref:Sec-independent protein translocase protein TatB n=1 Tax=Brevundimonas sp. TaxID=1871086 RepID=UPI0025C402D3|nr:Sec-independent protein translocase protein TatB [Brevundimonas sp.]
MGGLGPGIGGAEYLVIAVVALLVVGPERLPLLLRKLGKLVAKARGMANEFRNSFEDMARQSELDELRKEVEALRTGGTMHALGADADAAFKDIRADLNKPLEPAPEPAAMLAAPGEWPDSPPVMAPLTTPALEASPQPVSAKPRARKTPVKPKAVAKPKAKRPVGKTTQAKPRTPRASKVDL